MERAAWHALPFTRCDALSRTFDVRLQGGVHARRCNWRAAWQSFDRDAAASVHLRYETLDDSFEGIERLLRLIPELQVKLGVARDNGSRVRLNAYAAHRPHSALSGGFRKFDV